MMSALLRYRREASVTIVYLFLLLVLAALRPSFFATRFAGVWVTSAPALVAAVGMTLIILARHIDISIGSQFSICAVVAALAARAGFSMPTVLVISVLCGAAMGAVNGTLVATLGFPSIVATLATMVILEQSLRWMRQGESVYGLPDGFQWFGASQAKGQWFVVATALSVFAVAAGAARWLAAGRAVYAVGSNEEAARLAGMRPQRVVFSVFTLMGALIGLAAVLGAIRFPQVDPNIGRGLELQVIAAVVVGGTAISGGRGTLLGTLAGVALLGTIGAALGFLTNQAYWDRAVQGAIILAAVASDGLARRGGG